jgi:mannose-6-phosphate isomerase-like protein (cupin superfamily)
MFEESKSALGRSSGGGNEGVSVEAVPPENVLEFPPEVGLKFVITKAAADTDGEFIEIEGTMRAHSAGPPIHVHPHQEETYLVTSGTADVFLDGRWHHLRAGESLTVPKGAPHTIKNEHDEDVTAMNWHRPAVRFEEFSRTFHRLATSGRIKSLPPKDPSSLVYAAMLFTEYEDTQVVVKPPTFFLRFLAFVGRRLGYRLD